MKVIEIHEREARLFQRTDLFDSRGYSLLLPETRALSAIDLRELSEGVELRALGLIGYLPLTDRIALNLKPKFPINNFWEMLSIADESYSRILPVLRGYQSLETITPHLILIKSFCFFLKEILRVGFFRDYKEISLEGYCRPKIDIGKTLNRFIAKGQEFYSYSNFFDFTKNVRINGVIKSACVSFLKILSQNKELVDEKSILKEALMVLDYVHSESFYPNDIVLCDDLPKWSQEYYFGALSVYSIFLGYRRVGFLYGEKGCRMPSFLFSLDTIFENFIRNSFRSAFKDKKITVLDGNNPKHQVSLFQDNKRFPIKPDLIYRFGKDRKVVAIGEVKYKPRIDESDRYQVISHAIALNSPLAFWISPATNGVGGMEYVGEISTGIKFYHYKINIYNSLLENTEKMIFDFLSLITHDKEVA
ncbi:5-methylcytosine restriction system specificity protein McrC [Kosakonia oryziphila]|uniref:5-methylcytosine-specific restriction enzyme subunit McrC n=1 Tax=Kosakonia oryziphila TaxID=1005667 RepID=A0A1C4DEE1_9ENTR|nr:hypothetical protein [Kosakonia oryziphila]SCC29686.1 5-methylcytosine-specific restriction enzyme subunit McrC [Kosakonia oryziphila]